MEKTQGYINKIAKGHQTKQTVHCQLTCSFLIAESSLLKCNSLAIAQILEESPLCKITFCFLPQKALEDIESNDDSWPEELKNFLSIVLLQGNPGKPIDDMAMKDDVIFFQEPETLQNRRHIDPISGR